MPTADATTQASKVFLDRFEQPVKSTIANLFLRPVRAGAAHYPRAVLAEVLRELHERRARAAAGGWRETLELTEMIYATIAAHEKEAIAFGAWALEWEALPPEERERRKRQRGDQYRTAYMDRQPATERQVEYLRRMGYAGPIDSKAHASSLIDIYTRGGRVVERGAA